ncbi:DNA-binding protein [Teredinibacter turnerae]|uniref:DNA-binding protein n=1 Tax=Teredinibacter turnerae TaxID=2426 RepID=UPI0003A14351|nr:DNA-binding protein [Teredinibacter turnerae]
MSKRRNPVTQEDVREAAEKLKKDGRNVSVNAVIEIAGGSFSTVGPLVREWKEQEAALTHIEIPELVLDSVKKAAADIWKTASSLANEQVERVAKEKQKLAEETREYEEEVKRLESALKLVEKESSDLKKRLETADNRASELRSSNAALEAQLQEKKAEIEKHQAMIERQELRLSELQKELLAIAKKSSK